MLCVYIHRYLKAVTEKVTTGQGTVPIHKKTLEDVSLQKRPESFSDVKTKSMDCLALLYACFLLSYKLC